MKQTVYPSGTVRALLDTDHVTAATRQALQTRLETLPATTFRFFTEEESQLLRQIGSRLIQQADLSAPVDLIGPIDQRLIQGDSDGWRYAVMPADGQAYKLGLQYISQTAQQRDGCLFDQLSAEQQDALLQAVADGKVSQAIWERVSPVRFFEELLAELVEIYYSHPLVQETIGYAGMADQPAWERIGLNEREAREPEQQA